MKRKNLGYPGLMLAAILLAPTSAWSNEEGWRTRASAVDEFTSGDVAAEVVFGREIAARIMGRYKPYENEDLLKYVNLVGLSLAKNTNRPELDFRFMVLDTREINAYAAPGGYVFVTSGALALMQDEAELAGVLAHEIGHVTEMHVVKELKIKGIDDTSTAALARLVGGGTESAKAAFGQAVDKGLDMIFNDSYKREDEMQADRVSVTVTTLSGYDASALAHYLRRIRAQKEKVTVPDDIHPTFTSRISQINEVVGRDGINIDTQMRNPQRFSSQLATLKSGLAAKK